MSACSDLVPPTREDIEKMVTKKGRIIDINLDSGTYVKQLFENAYIAADGILQQKWEILRANGGRKFITSDNPLAIKSNRRLADYEILAILLPGSIKYFPLDKKTCLKIYEAKRDTQPSYSYSNSKETKLINNLLYSQAHRYTISGDEILLRKISLN